jgi:hypothetical protein
MNKRTLLIVLAIALAVQTAHFSEHIAQIVQIYLLDIKPPQAHGLLGRVFDFEWVHYGYNIGLELALLGIWLRYRRLVSRDNSVEVSQGGRLLLLGLVIFQGYHSVEHTAKLYQYLFIPLYQSGEVPTPGILPELTAWPIFLVHFGFNLIVWVAMALSLWRMSAMRIKKASVSPA